MIRLTNRFPLHDSVTLIPHFRLKGVVSLDIDISNLEINQCEVENNEDNDNQIYSFHGTHKCPNETTYVSMKILLINFRIKPNLLI